MFVSRKLRRKIFAILLTVTITVMLLPGVSLGAGILSSLSFISTADHRLTEGQTSSVNFELFDDIQNPYTQPVYATILDSNSIVQAGSAGALLAPAASGVYTITGVSLNEGTYTLNVTDGTKTVTVTGQINVKSDTSGNLAFVNFVSDSDNNLVLGVTQNINYKLYAENGTQYTGAVTAYINDPDGHSTSYPASSSSISNVTFDRPGTYTLYINTGTNTVIGNIYVTNPNFTTYGSFIANCDSKVTVKLAKSDGDPLSRQTVTVDASDVGGTSANYTTLYDGTLTIDMTPTKVGTVKITLGGHNVGEIQVIPTYTAGARLGGASTDNSSLSVLVAQQGWTAADNVILTRDDLVSDAMTAASLSKKLDAPILMTPTNLLDGGVLAEIKSLKAKRVYIIGGTGAVSQSVANALSGAGFNVIRISGADRYDTAAQIGAQVGSPGTVYLAYGYGEADALAAGAIAAEQGIPILLTDTNSLPLFTQNELTALKPSKIILLGGTGVISSDLETQLAGNYFVQRWGGVDRYATELSIFQNYLSQITAANQYPLYITSSYVSSTDVGSGKPFGDAVVTAALAAKKNGLVITLPPNSLPGSISTFILYNKGHIPSATVVGNVSAISYNLEQIVQQKLAH